MPEDEGRDVMHQLLEEIRLLRQEQSAFIASVSKSRRLSAPNDNPPHSAQPTEGIGKESAEEEGEIPRDLKHVKLPHNPQSMRNFWATRIPNSTSLEGSLKDFTGWLRRPVQVSTHPHRRARVRGLAGYSVVPSSLGVVAWHEFTAAVKEAWPWRVPYTGDPTSADFTIPTLQQGGRRLDLRDDVRIFHGTHPHALDFESQHAQGPPGSTAGPLDPVCIPDGLICHITPPRLDASTLRLNFHSTAFIFNLLGNTSNNGRTETVGTVGPGSYNASTADTDRFYHDPVTSFATLWPMDEPRFNYNIDHPSLCLQYSIRSFGIDIPPSTDAGDVPGLLCERESATFAFFDKNFVLSERRYSVVINVAFAAGGSYVLLLLCDRDQPWRLDFLDDPLETCGLEANPLARGVVLFQCAMCFLVIQWEDEWAATLLVIEGVLIVKVHDVLERESREQLMYDDENLQRSEFYFSLLQLLRMFSEYIGHSLADLQDLATKSQEVLRRLSQQEPGLKAYGMHIGQFREAAGVIDGNWDVVVARQKTAGEALLGRIGRKIEEIESLRDGLFNAQSVREAIRGTQINKYLFVFTVLTILFLPPSFVATFYGMHIFDGDDGIEGTQQRFWKVFGGVSGATYLLGAVALTSFNWRKWWRKLGGQFLVTNLAIQPIQRLVARGTNLVRANTANKSADGSRPNSFAFKPPPGSGVNISMIPGGLRGKKKTSTEV